MAELKVTIREELTLNGYDQGAKNTLTISDVDEVFKRIVTCPANNETTVARFRSSVGNASGTATFDSALDVQDVKYVRVTNLDGSNPVTLSLQVSNDEDGAADFSSSILLEAGKSFLMGTPHDGIQVSDANANVITTLVDLESIIADPAGNDVKVEVFIASVV